MAGYVVMIILLSFYFGVFCNFKHYYLLYVKEHLTKKFLLKRNKEFKGLIEVGKSVMG